MATVYDAQGTKAYLVATTVLLHTSLQVINRLQSLGLIYLRLTFGLSGKKKRKKA